MRELSNWLIVVGGGSDLGMEAARQASQGGVNVVLVDISPVDSVLKQNPRVSVFIGSLLDENLMENAFATCQAAESISVVFVTSGRKELVDGKGFESASEIQIQALHTWGSRFLKAHLDKQINMGTFFLISSVNSQLQSHSNPFYGALKAGAESLIQALATEANSSGRGSFVTLRLGYVNFGTSAESLLEHPSRKAARILLGKRPLVEWGDVARVILGIVSLETQVLNGSTLWCDFGVHLLEQTHVLSLSLGLGDAKP